jgi:hypothetical protein
MNDITVAMPVISISKFDVADASLLSRPKLFNIGLIINPPPIPTVAAVTPVNIPARMRLSILSLISSVLILSPICIFFFNAK